MLDKPTPIAERERNFGGPGELCRARGVAARERDDGGARVKTEGRQLHQAAVVTTDNSDSDQGSSRL
jgi:hypothetical protein